MSRTPREIAEEVRKMVAGEGVTFADLFAPEGVIVFPFAPPGMPRELRGRDVIRAHYADRAAVRGLLAMEGVEARVWETDDPEVVIAEITHHGQSNVTGAPYRFTALAVIRVRDGEIVHYDDYMDPIAMARMLGRTGELAAALSDLRG
jgi:ketosteroid isomerase-like protein